VIDDSNGEVVAFCVTNSTTDSNPCHWATNQEIHDQVCVPTDGCFRSVISQDGATSILDSVTQLDIQYGSEQIFVGSQFQFTSVLLQNSQSSSSSTCTSSCLTEDGARGLELELFLFYVDGNVAEEDGHDWLIKDKNSELEFPVTVRNGDRPLTYHRQCILDCAELVIPDELSGDTHWRTDQGIGVEVRVDGIIYGGTKYDQLPFTQSLLVGACSSEQALCPGSLLQADFVLNDSSSLNLPFYSLRLYHYPELKKNAETSEHIDPAPLMMWTGESFRRYDCVDYFGAALNEGCTVIPSYLLHSLPKDSMQISVNGRTIEDRIDCYDPPPQYEFFCKHVIQSDDLFIPLNDGCESRRLRNTRIFAPLAVVILFLVVGFVIYRNRPSQKSPWRRGVIKQ